MTNVRTEEQAKKFIEAIKATDLNNKEAAKELIGYFLVFIDYTQQLKKGNAAQVHIHALTELIRLFDGTSGPELAKLYWLEESAVKHGLGNAIVTALRIVNYGSNQETRVSATPLIEQVARAHKIKDFPKHIKQAQPLDLNKELQDDFSAFLAQQNLQHLTSEQEHYLEDDFNQFLTEEIALKRQTETPDMNKVPTDETEDETESEELLSVTDSPGLLNDEEVASPEAISLAEEQQEQIQTQQRESKKFDLTEFSAWQPEYGDPNPPGPAYKKFIERLRSLDVNDPQQVRKAIAHLLAVLDYENELKGPKKMYGPYYRAREELSYRFSKDDSDALAKLHWLERARFYPQFYELEKPLCRALHIVTTSGDTRLTRKVRGTFTRRPEKTLAELRGEYLRMDLKPAIEETTPDFIKALEKNVGKKVEKFEEAEDERIGQLLEQEQLRQRYVAAYIEACDNYIAHLNLNSTRITLDDDKLWESKLTIMKTLRGLLDDVKNPRGEIIKIIPSETKLQRFHEQLARRGSLTSNEQSVSEILMKRHDSGFVTFVKALGVFAAGLLLIVPGILAYKSLFKSPTKGQEFVESLGNIQHKRGG